MKTLIPIIMTPFIIAGCASPRVTANNSKPQVEVGVDLLEVREQRKQGNKFVSILTYPIRYTKDNPWKVLGGAAVAGAGYLAYEEWIADDGGSAKQPEEQIPTAVEGVTQGGKNNVVILKDVETVPENVLQLGEGNRIEIDRAIPE